MLEQLNSQGRIIPCAPEFVIGVAHLVKEILLIGAKKSYSPAIRTQQLLEGGDENWDLFLPPFLP